MDGRQDGPARYHARWWRADSAPSAQASLVLLAFAARHYGYYWFPRELQGEVFAMFGAGILVCLVLALRVWQPIAVWVIAEEFQVAGCAAWWILDPLPWTDEQCSARVDFKLGAIGIAWLSLVCVKSVMSYRCSNEQKE